MIRQRFDTFRVVEPLVKFLPETSRHVTSTFITSSFSDDTVEGLVETHGFGVLSRMVCG